MFKVKVTSGVMVNPGRPGLSDQLGAAGAVGAVGAVGAGGLRPLGSGTAALAEPASSAGSSTSAGADTTQRKAVRAPLSDRVAADAGATKRVRR